MSLGSLSSSRSRLLPAIGPNWVALALGLVLMSLLLSGCGFRLKQAQPLPYNTLYTNINTNTAFGDYLERLLVVNSPQLRLVSSPDQAEVQLIQHELDRAVRELSLDPAGHVENYELRVRLVFSLVNAQGETLLAPTELISLRETPNTPGSTEATHMEINYLFETMEISLVERMLNRISAPEVLNQYQLLSTESTSP